MWNVGEKIIGDYLVNKILPAPPPYQVCTVVVVHFTCRFIISLVHTCIYQGIDQVKRVNVSIMKKMKFKLSIKETNCKQNIIFLCSSFSYVEIDIPVYKMPI